MESFKQAIGTEPKQNQDGTYWPSKAGMKLAVPQTTEYTQVNYANPVNERNFRVLVLCTDEEQLKCANDKVFKTGNHPTEVFTVVRHLEAAGFNVDFATPTGKAIPIEEFAIPHQDALTIDEINKYRGKLDNPFAARALLDSLDNDSRYVAIYVPGGHGVLLSVPFSPAAGALLRWFIDHDKFVITLCHGPAGLLSLALEEASAADFPLAGYELVLFPAHDDALLADAGYLPGKVTWSFQQRLEALGMKVQNHLPTGSTHVDRKLISGDSPSAADALGQLASKTMLEALNPQNQPTPKPKPGPPILSEDMADLNE